MIPQIEIIIIASLVALACSLVGVFLVLRKVSLMSDAISHSILLGIVLAFFVVEDITSPYLILGATLVGVLTVFLTELIINTKKIKEDASIGLVFPFLFSLGVILITKFASNVHLDTDAVLLGELAFAPFDRFLFLGMDIAPKSMVLMAGILVLVLLFIIFFYKELKLVTFDSALATSLGFSPLFFHYLIMTLVSITAVGSFEAVGSILVVALMIAPPAAAYLLTHKLSRMLILSGIIGIASAVLGYGLAFLFNANIGSSMALMTGVFFVLALLFSKSHGLLAQVFSYYKKKYRFASEMLVVHLLDHEGTKEEKTENTITNATKHMNWSEKFAKKVVDLSVHKGWITRSSNQLYLTKLGRTTAQQVMVRT